MNDRDWLTEDEVILGTKNYLLQKGHTSRKHTFREAKAAIREQGIDLKVKLANDKGRGNLYFIEAKGSLKSNREPMRSEWSTNFRWAVSQIILRIKVNSTRNNYIYGIALPRSDAEKAIRLIRDN